MRNELRLLNPQRMKTRNLVEDNLKRNIITLRSTNILHTLILQKPNTMYEWQIEAMTRDLYARSAYEAVWHNIWLE